MFDFKETLKKFGIEYFNRYYACYRGFVANNEDPMCGGRLQLKVPQVYGKDVNEYWAYPKGMFMGKQIGLYAIPNIGDLVWVSFENGDPRYPIWEYGHWTTGDPIANLEGRPVNERHVVMLQTTTGHRLEFDDDNGIVRIRNTNGAVIELGTDSRINISNSAENMESLLDDLIQQVQNLKIIVTGTAGTVDPISVAALGLVITRLKTLLK